MVDEGNKMRKSIQNRGVRSVYRASISGIGSVDADDLKLLVRDGLAAMTTVDRVAFILTFERELRSANLSMRAYLFPLGISVTSPEELTPGEVGHLVRFLKMNVPKAMRVVDGAIERLATSAEGVARPGDRLAA